MFADRQTNRRVLLFSKAASSSKHKVCGLSLELPNWNQRSLQDGRSRLPRWSDNSIAYYSTVAQQVFRCGTQVGYDTFGCTLMSGGPLRGDRVKQETASGQSLDKQTVCICTVCVWVRLGWFEWHLYALCFSPCTQLNWV